VAKKTLQFEMISIIDFGCNEDHPGSPALVCDPGGAHSSHTTEEAPHCCIFEYEVYVMSMRSSSILAVVARGSIVG
jgi:hypothetical protein